MLNHLALRSARRQLREYALYFLTLACTAAFLYAFNALCFSESVRALPGLEVLPYMIAAASALLVLIMGWLVGYMAGYMLRRRSREFALYLLSGVPNREIAALLFSETLWLGALTLLLGLPVGWLLSQLLEAGLLHLFGLGYRLRSAASLPAAGLTLLYFSAMLLCALRKNARWLRRVQLRALLDYGRQTEQAPLPDGRAGAALLLASLLAGGAGFWLVYRQPWGKGYDILAGMTLLVLFLFGLFRSVPAFLAAQLGARPDWKYRPGRLVPFRDFTAKARSMSAAMGFLAALFLLSFTCMGLGTAAYTAAEKNLELAAFDLMVLHQGDAQGLAGYEETLRALLPLRAGHAYTLYTGPEQTLRTVCSRSVEKAGYARELVFAEFVHDTYIKQSDYAALRALLGYEAAALDPAACSVHCLPALEADFRAAAGKTVCAGYPLAEGGVFTEPFGQLRGYGNGLDFLIVVPDEAAQTLDVLYSLYAAATEEPLNSEQLAAALAACGSLASLTRNSAKSAPGGALTMLLRPDSDYLTGKWVDKEIMGGFYALLLCLFYFALILEIAGAAILVTQLLSDRDRRQRQNRLLRQLGMERRRIERLEARWLGLLFLLPALPALAVGGCFVWAGARRLERGLFPLPVFGGGLWVLRPLGAALGVFALLYGVYYLAARVSS